MIDCQHRSRNLGTISITTYDHKGFLNFLNVPWVICSAIYFSNPNLKANLKALVISRQS